VWDRQTYLEHGIDEGLGVVPRKVSNHLNLVTVGEIFHDQRDALIRTGVVDQLLPDWAFATHEEAAGLAIVRLPERVGNQHSEKDLQDF